MLYKGLMFATATVVAAFSTLTAASAVPFNGIALQHNDTLITKMDYYYPGYDEGEAPYYGEGLADVPGYGRDLADVPGYYWRGPAEAPRYGRGLADGDVIGGALGAVTGAIAGALHGSGTYARPYYSPSYDEAPHDSGYGGAYHESPVAACQRNFPYFDARTGTYVTESGDEFVCPYLER